MRDRTGCQPSEQQTAQQVGGSFHHPSWSTKQNTIVHQKFSADHILQSEVCEVWGYQLHLKDVWGYQPYLKDIFRTNSTEIPQNNNIYNSWTTGQNPAVQFLTDFPQKNITKWRGIERPAGFWGISLSHTSRRKPYRDQISPPGNQGFLSAHILVCWAETRRDTPNSVSTILYPSPFYNTMFTLFNCRSLNSTTR